MCAPASEMGGGKHLLLFTVFLLLETCQPKPQVTMSPQLNEVFPGDIFYLNCINRGSEVTWYFNGKPTEKPGKNGILKIEVASPTDSLSYRCVDNTESSDDFNIKVLDSAPRASLTIETGHPVMQFGHSAVLQLHSDDGLEGWMCHVYREAKNEKKTIKFRLHGDNNTVVFQSASLKVPETIYWCTDQAEKTRSNQIILRASAEDLSLEMYPYPAVLGEKLALRCLVWGTDQITEAFFYKGNEIINRPDKGATYMIPEVTASTGGNYTCKATYTHKGRTHGPSYQKVSEVQYVFVQERPITAILSDNKGLMSCSCNRPTSQKIVRCYWYHKTNGGQWEHLKHWTECDMTPEKAGSYACRAVWDNRRSELSAAHSISGPPTNAGLVITIIIFLLLLAMICLGIGFYRYKRTPSAQNRIYEEMPMRDRDYEDLKGSGAKREGEYDTLHPTAADKDKKTGEYEALKKGGATDEVYHTLGEVGGAAGGDGGYEALKKEGVKEGVYHTLKAEGAAAAGGGDGGYEALKKEGMKEGVYHTLKADVVATEGGDGGYEALKKGGERGGIPHSQSGEYGRGEGR